MLQNILFVLCSIVALLLEMLCGSVGIIAPDIVLSFSIFTIFSQRIYFASLLILLILHSLLYIDHGYGYVLKFLFLYGSMYLLNKYTNITLLYLRVLKLLVLLLAYNLVLSVCFAYYYEYSVNFIEILYKDIATIICFGLMLSISRV